MKNCGKAILIGLAFVGMGLVFVFVFGQITELSCEKPKVNVTQCTLERKFLGILTVSTKEFSDINDAWVESSCDDEGCTYRVMLLTSMGQQPMTGYYSSGESVKVRMAREINQYIQSEDFAPVFMSDKSGMFFALFALIFVLVGLYIIIMKGIIQPLG